MDNAIELIVADHVPFINPADYSISSIKAINPTNYFITSGDAIAKTVYLEKVMTKELATARKTFKNGTAKQKKFIRDFATAVTKCRKFIDFLKGLRGDAIWLETDWINHQLFVTPKNPRAKGMPGDDL